MAMEVVILVELETGAAAARRALLEQVGVLALANRARLSFVATQAPSDGTPACDIVAVGLVRGAEAPALVERWRAEGTLPAGASARILTVQPLWSMEPLALMFP